MTYLPALVEYDPKSSLVVKINEISETAIGNENISTIENKSSDSLSTLAISYHFFRSSATAVRSICYATNYHVKLYTKSFFYAIITK